VKSKVTFDHLDSQWNSQRVKLTLRNGYINPREYPAENFLPPTHTRGHASDIPLRGLPLGLLCPLIHRRIFRYRSAPTGSREAKGEPKICQVCPSIHLIRGIAVHTAIGKFYSEVMNKGHTREEPVLQEIIESALQDCWMDQKANLMKLDLTGDEIMFFYRESVGMTQNFVHDFLASDGLSASKPTIEKTLFSKKYMTLGRIDAIHNSQAPPLLVDFKTSKSRELKEEYKVQMAIYSILYEENFGAKPTVGIHFVKFKEGLETFTIGDDYLDEVKSMILETHEKTQSENIEDYPCTCGWCSKNFEGVEADGSLEAYVA
jgi:hypothetical protein